MTVTGPSPPPRLPLLDTSEDPLTQKLLEQLASDRAILNLHRMMAHAPALMRASRDTAQAFRRDTALPRALVELVILRTAQVVDTDYIWLRHLPLGRSFGVTEQQLQELAGWPDSAAFTPAQKAALGFAERAARRTPMKDDDFSVLRGHFSPREIVEMALLVGHYVSTAIFINATSLPPEEKDIMADYKIDGRLR